MRLSIALCFAAISPSALATFCLFGITDPLFGCPSNGPVLINIPGILNPTPTPAPPANVDTPPAVAPPAVAPPAQNKNTEVQPTPTPAPQVASSASKVSTILSMSTVVLSAQPKLSASASSAYQAVSVTSSHTSTSASATSTIVPFTGAANSVIASRQSILGLVVLAGIMACL